MHIALDGTVGILSNCNKAVYLFNRLGKLENKISIINAESNFLIKLLGKWFAISVMGQITS